MNPFFERTRRPLLILACAVALVAIALRIKTRHFDSSSSPPIVAANKLNSDESAVALSHAPSNTAAASSVKAKPIVEENLDQALRSALNLLRTQQNPENSRAVLASLRERLTRPGSEAEGVAAIRRFLDSGEDATTALAFRVGPSHTLAEAPTLRTALLDWLGQLDHAAAAEYSGLVFQTMSSPEEYAMALRNFAQGRPTQREELRSHFERLRTHVPWASRPTAGYLEAFDVVPYLAEPSFIEPLASLLSPSSPTPLRHASLVALDRLVIANPLAALTEVIGAHALDDQPQTRASFLARADVRDPGQRQAVERYLSSSSLSDSELDYFVTLFPNVNRFVSPNLLTDSGMQSLPEIAAMDAAALARVRAWQTEPQFRRWQPQLERLAKRLQEHVESASRGGYSPRR